MVVYMDLNPLKSGLRERAEGEGFSTKDIIFVLLKTEDLLNASEQDTNPCVSE